MIFQLNGNTLQVTVGDIAKQLNDCIVNAANGSLLGGGGVDGAIHEAAGPELLAACKKVRETELNGAFLDTGEAVITEGYRLPAKHVIHTVGPIWDPTLQEKQKVQLANCYRNSLELAEVHGLTSIVFPSISTGAYGFPIELASFIALKTIESFLRQYTFGKVIITCFSEDDYEVYKEKAENLIWN